MPERSNDEHGRAEIRSVLLVTNPLSGRGRGQIAGIAAANRLRAHDIEVTGVSGATAAETIRLVRDRLAGDTVPDAVLCAGGDGLVCITLQALAGSDVPLGLVPGGTGNDLARELGVPQDDPIAAADIVRNGSVRTIDLGEVHAESGASEPMRFATVAATGFDARVTLRANRMRYPGGRLRYPLAALAELAGSLAVPTRIELSGVPGQSETTVVETGAVMVAVGNTRTYGGGMLICPDALVDDGLLDVSVVGAISRVQMVRLLPVISSGHRVDHPAITQYRAAQVRVVATGTPATADGEPVGALPVNVRALADAQTVLVA